MVVCPGAPVVQLPLLPAGHLLVVLHLLGILAFLLPVVPILLLLMVLIPLLGVPIPKGLPVAGSVGRISSWLFRKPLQRVALV